MNATENAIERALSDVALLADLAPEAISALVRFGEERAFDPDEVILHMDAEADVFHLIQSGLVALEVESSRHGPLVIETIGSGDVVGISWLLPPYRWVFGARAVEPTTTIAFDVAPLLAMCDEEPVLGYQIYKRFAAVVHHRLVAARMRALDLYGAPR